MKKIGIAGKIIYTFIMLFYGQYKVDQFLKYIRNWKNSDEKARQIIQDQQFLKIIRYAYRNVPFYRTLYRNAGVDINSIHGIADIEKLPIVHKEQLRNSNLKTIRPAFWKNPLSVKVSTTGSSGWPFSFYRSKETLFINGAQLLTYFDNWGLRRKKRIYYLLHFADPTFCINLPRRSKYSIFNKRHSISPDLPIEKIIQIIKADTPDCLIGHPSMIEDLTDYLIERNDKITNDIVFATGGEMLTNILKKKLNRVFPNHAIYDFYNSMEMGMMAWESQDHSGLHINDYAVVIEKGESIVDSAGECYSKPIMTNLWNFSTPFIRYDGIDDLLIFSKDKSPFAYGKESIISMQGRKAEKIIDNKNRSVSACVLMTSLSDLTDVRRFQFVHSTPGEICFRYTASQNCNPGHIKKVVTNVFKHFFNDSMKISFEKVDHIQKIGVSGKHPLLVKK
jgi:phenylacetate-CoA ligase